MISFEPSVQTDQYVVFPVVIYIADGHVKEPNSLVVFPNRFSIQIDDPTGFERPPRYLRFAVLIEIDYRNVSHFRFMLDAVIDIPFRLIADLFFNLTPGSNNKGFRLSRNENIDARLIIDLAGVNRFDIALISNRLIGTAGCDDRNMTVSFLFCLNRSFSLRFLKNEYFLFFEHVLPYVYIRDYEVC